MQKTLQGAHDPRQERALVPSGTLVYHATEAQAEGEPRYAVAVRFFSPDRQSGMTFALGSEDARALAADLVAHASWAESHASGTKAHDCGATPRRMFDERADEK